MNKTRLFVYKEPTLHNPTFEYTLTTVGDYWDDWWQYPTGTVFTNGCIVPFPDTLDGDYAITQNIGISNHGGVVYFAITIDKWGVPDGMIDIGIGNAHYIIDPSLYANNTFPYTIDLYELNVPLNAAIPDPDWNYYVTIRGSGGTYLAGNPVKNWGIKSIYLRGAYTENYREVDLYDNLEVPVVYNVADVRDISKKDSNFSLDFSVPNTPNNADLFDHIYEITDNASMFEILKQYPCYLEVDNNRTFDGYFKMTKVIINDNREVSYECNLYSNVIEFMKRLGTTTLRGNANPADDLSFSEYTMTLDALTWFNRTSPMTYGKDCFFAPVDKYNLDNRNWLMAQPPTETYNVPCIQMYYDELTPFLYYKEILDKIFKWAGFNYVSDFINNTANNTTTFEFEKIVYPGVNTKQFALNDIYSTVSQVTSDENIYSPYDNHIYGRLLGSWSGTSVPDVLVATENPTFFDQWSQCGIDESNAGQTTLTSSSAYRYTFPQGGTYSVNLTLPLRIAFYLTDEHGSILTGGLPTTVYADFLATYWYSVNLILHQTSTNTDIVIETLSSGLQNYASSYDRGYNGSIVIYEDIWEAERNIYVEANDYLYFTVTCSLEEHTGSSIPPGLLTYTFFDPDDYDNTRWPHKLYFEITRTTDANFLPKQLIDVRLISDFSVGGMFDPTVILNPKRKKTDFITDIIKKFNLYIEDVTYKKDDNGIYYSNYAGIRPNEPILRIEPRNLYYENTAVVRNWTEKTDVSSIEFERIDDYLYKQIMLNDDNDKTYFVEDYNTHRYTEGEYGEEIIVSPYNISDDEQLKITTKLGQTMCGLVKRYDNLNHNKWLQCPFIFTLNNDGSVKTDVEYDDRMLFVFDLQHTDALFQDIWDDGHKYFALYNRNNDLGSSDWSNEDGLKFIASYCLLDHFNIPFGKDTADLNFGWANWYYQNLNGTWATSYNCYNVFYKDMIDDYNSPEARLMKCKMYLKSSDIRDLQLSDTILVNNVAYHINKIKQWKSEYEPVEVELIKIIQSNSIFEQPIRKNKPPKMEIVTLNTLKELIESQNKAISEMSKQVENLDGTIKKMDEQLIELDERINKLEDGGMTQETNDDGSIPNEKDKDE